MNYNKCYTCPHCEEWYAEDAKGHLLNLICKVTGNKITIRECPEDKPDELWQEASTETCDPLSWINTGSGLHLSPAPPGNIPHPESNRIIDESRYEKLKEIYKRMTK